MFREPFVHVEKEELLRPEHAGQRLAHDECFIFADTWWCDGLVELIGFAPSGSA